MNVFKSIFSALGGRKFFALIMATVLIIIDKIPAEIWLTVVGIYCASNVLQKVFYEKNLNSDKK